MTTFTIVEEDVIFTVKEEDVIFSIEEEEINFQITEETVDFTIVEDIVDFKVVEENVIFDITGDILYNDKVVVQYNCDPSLLPGVFVAFSLTENDKVEEVTNNNSNRVIGYVVSKKSDILANIITYGIVYGFTGLSNNLPVYLSENGNTTNIIPNSNYVQMLGIAKSDTSFLFNPEKVRIKRLSI